jgi:hypothetical protein
MTQTDELKLEKWERMTDPRRRAPNPALLEEVVAGLQENIDILMQHKAAKKIPNLWGLCMFQAIIANKSNWLKLLDEAVPDRDIDFVRESVYGTSLTLRTDHGQYSNRQRAEWWLDSKDRSQCIIKAGNQNSKFSLQSPQTASRKVRAFEIAMAIWMSTWATLSTLSSMYLGIL